jgi:hypothetical protein
MRAAYRFSMPNDPQKERSPHVELLDDIDEDILEAAREVDTTLIDWLLSLPPLSRVSWSSRMAATLERFKRVE